MEQTAATGWHQTLPGQGETDEGWTLLGYCSFVAELAHMFIKFSVMPTCLLILELHSSHYGSNKLYLLSTFLIFNGKFKSTLGNLFSRS